MVLGRRYKLFSVNTEWLAKSLSQSEKSGSTCPVFMGLAVIEASLSHSDTTLSMTPLDSRQHIQEKDIHAPSGI
jgi:hypothetical protein